LAKKPQAVDWNEPFLSEWKIRMNIAKVELRKSVKIAKLVGIGQK
jgi:hypothetical protein